MTNPSAADGHAQVPALSSVIHRLAAVPWVYDGVQIAAGLRQIQAHLAPYVACMGAATVLDVGAGTGLALRVLPKSARYVWLDIDPEKLKGFRRKWPAVGSAVLGDAAELCIESSSVEYALCLAMSHHLTDDQLQRLFRELRRVVQRRVVFLDALDAPELPLSRFLWRYDRGSAPRPAATLLDLIQTEFRVERSEEFRVFHRYLLCTAVSR